MTATFQNPEEFDPTNGNENNNNDNLQSNSEENTQPENAETNNGSGRRHYRKDNKVVSNLKVIKKSKQGKVERLTSERDAKRGDLNRGYLIVPLDDQRSKHVTLDTTDKAILGSSIAEKDFEIYELGLDIAEINQKIQGLATAKKTTFKGKLNKKKADKIEDDLVKRVIKELDEASKNGSSGKVIAIRNQVQTGNKSEAYNSLKSFLSQNVKTVSRKLSKSKELESNVLDRVLDKQTFAQ